jgi:hypothetical protein
MGEPVAGRFCRAGVVVFGSSPSLIVRCQKRLRLSFDWPSRRYLLAGLWKKTRLADQSFALFSCNGEHFSGSDAKSPANVAVLPI